ncbi:MAG: DegT/DnrJ/EryC1/StrS family aminotransferase [Rubrivivax sp.]|nr:DegT/DnrJ/EryC1/StrS family aminotransferase [Rubrivivax sp.]
MDRLAGLPHGGNVIGSGDHRHAIHVLVPDLPRAEELLPWLRRIDEQRWYTNRGPLVCEFERRLLPMIAADDGTTCVTLSSGMSALELGWRALGIGIGHRVLMPSLTFPATAQAARRWGAEPVFADVCASSWTLTPGIAREAIARTPVDAVMPVACFGRPVPVDAWDRFAGDTGLPVFVDAAAALGSQRVGRRTHVAFSLHATKPLGVGEGGLFASPDATLTDRVRRLANFDFDHRLVRSADATNAKLSEYAAAVGLAQLERWPALAARREQLFGCYRDLLGGVEGVALQEGGATPPATLCVRLRGDAAGAAAALEQAGIETRRWYLPPLHEHPPFRDAVRIGPAGRSELPVTRDLASSLLGLPFHTLLSTDDVARVVTALRCALRC